MKNKTLSYKGYIGTIEFSLEDRILFGTVKGINDLLVYEGATIDELEISFHEVIDDYLNMCKELGKSPDKTLTGSFNVRLGEDLHKKLVADSISQGISQNECLKSIIDGHYNNRIAKEIGNIFKKIEKTNSYYLNVVRANSVEYTSDNIYRIKKEGELRVQ